MKKILFPPRPTQGLKKKKKTQPIVTEPLGTGGVKT